MKNPYLKKYCSDSHQLWIFRSGGGPDPVYQNVYRLVKVGVIYGLFKTMHISSQHLHASLEDTWAKPCIVWGGRVPLNTGKILMPPSIVDNV